NGSVNGRFNIAGVRHRTIAGVGAWLSEACASGLIILEVSKLRRHRVGLAIQPRTWDGPMIATSFTPVASLIGGALIGASAVMLMASTGRIAGVSGIAARLLPPYEDREFAGRLAFIGGLVAAPVIVLLATGRLPVQTIEANAVRLVLA